MERKREYEKPYVEIMFFAEDDLIRTSLNIGGIGTDPKDPWSPGTQ